MTKLERCGIVLVTDDVQLLVHLDGRAGLVGSACGQCQCLLAFLDGLCHDNGEVTALWSNHDGRIDTQPARVTCLLCILVTGNGKRKVTIGSIGKAGIGLQTFVTVVVGLVEERTVPHIGVQAVGGQLLCIVRHVPVDLLVRHIDEDVGVELIEVLLALQRICVHELVALGHVVERVVVAGELACLFLEAGNLPWTLTAHGDKVFRTRSIAVERAVQDVEVDSQKLNTTLLWVV